MHFIRIRIHLSPQQKSINVYSSSNRKEFIDVPNRSIKYIQTYTSIYSISKSNI